MSALSILGIVAAFIVIGIITYSVLTPDTPTLGEMQTRPGSLASMAMQTEGPQPVAVKITGKQCRQKCKGVCGGSRPIVGLTKKQKEKRACFDNCRSQNCGWVGIDELND